MLPRTVRHGATAGCGGTYPRRPARRRSRTPSDGSMSPAAIRSRVVLPHPLGPTTPRNSLSRTENVTPRRARTLPAYTLPTPVTRRTSESKPRIARYSLADSVPRRTAGPRSGASSSVGISARCRTCGARNCHECQRLRSCGLPAVSAARLSRRAMIGTMSSERESSAPCARLASRMSGCSVRRASRRWASRDRPVCSSRSMSPRSAIALTECHSSVASIPANVVVPARICSSRMRRYGMGAGARDASNRSRSRDLLARPWSRRLSESCHGWPTKKWASSPSSAGGPADSTRSISPSSRAWRYESNVSPGKAHGEPAALAMYDPARRSASGSPPSRLDSASASIRPPAASPASIMSTRAPASLSSSGTGCNRHQPGHPPRAPLREVTSTAPLAERTSRSHPRPSWSRADPAAMAAGSSTLSRTRSQRSSRASSIRHSRSAAPPVPDQASSRA